jgi:hypothetical protein
MRQDPVMRRSLCLFPLAALVLLAGCGGTGRVASTTTPSSPTVAAPTARGPALSRVKYLARVREIYCSAAANIDGYQEEIETLDDANPRSADIMGEMSGYWGLAAREIGALEPKLSYRDDAERFVATLQDVADFYSDAEHLMRNPDDSLAEKMNARYEALGPAGANAALALGFEGCEE